MPTDSCHGLPCPCVSYGFVCWAEVKAFFSFFPPSPFGAGISYLLPSSLSPRSPSFDTTTKVTTMAQSRARTQGPFQQPLPMLPSSSPTSSSPTSSSSPSSSWLLLLLFGRAFLPSQRLRLLCVASYAFLFSFLRVKAFSAFSLKPCAPSKLGQRRP